MQDNSAYDIFSRELFENGEQKEKIDKLKRKQKRLKRKVTKLERENTTLKTICQLCGFDPKHLFGKEDYNHGNSGADSGIKWYR